VVARMAHSMEGSSMGRAALCEFDRPRHTAQRHCGSGVGARKFTCGRPVRRSIMKFEFLRHVRDGPGARQAIRAIERRLGSGTFACFEYAGGRSKGS
jgi:hypothetical protein